MNLSLHGGGIFTAMISSSSKQKSKAGPTVLVMPVSVQQRLVNRKNLMRLSKNTRGLVDAIKSLKNNRKGILA